MNKRSKLNGLKLARVATLSFSLLSQLKKQLEDYKEEGIDITLVSGSDDGMSIIDELKINHKKIVIPRDISIIRDLIALFKLYFFFKSNKFDIVHSTTPKAGLLTAIAAYLAGVPLRFHTFTGQAWANLKGLKRWICIFMDKVIISLNTKVFADSNSQVKFLYENNVIRNKKNIHVLGNGSLAGVDLDVFSKSQIKNRDQNRENINIPRNAFVFIFLGRINIDKGIKELLEAFISIVKGNSEAYLLLVGPFDIKDPVEKSRIENTINKTKNILRHNYTSHPETFLSMSDVLCCPSYREGFGTVIIEAGAMGLPSIGSNVIGLEDSIIHNETGLLFEKGNKEELRKNMKLLMNNPDLRKRLGSNAYHNSVNNFSSSKLSQLVLDEYKNYYE